MAEPQQNLWELREFLKVIEERVKVHDSDYGPFKVLEIGTNEGGTTRQILGVVPKDAIVCGMDIHPHPDVLALLKEDKRYRHLVGDSDTQDSYTWAFAFEPFDVIFIDGDHTYEGVKSDFWNYLKLAVGGDGIVALHDIKTDYLGDACRVHRLWDEIKAAGAYDTYEIVDNEGHDPKYWDPGALGIGVVYL